MKSEKKKQMSVRLRADERRALRMLAGARGISVTEWTSEMIAQAWAAQFPNTTYPDVFGKVQPAKRKRVEIEAEGGEE